MKITGTNGDSIDLQIAGYQFPEQTEDFYDANWLMIRVESSIAGKRWAVCDPSLCTFEVKGLIDWLRSGTIGSEESNLEFVEPNYRFQMLPPSSPVLMGVRVLLELEARPAWAAQNTAYHDDCWIDLECTPDVWRSLADDLEMQLARFPIRGEALRPPECRGEAEPQKGLITRLISLIGMKARS
jgi:hypothetical protein